jgi:alkaline phosphatase
MSHPRLTLPSVFRRAARSLALLALATGVARPCSAAGIAPAGGASGKSDASAARSSAIPRSAAASRPGFPRNVIVLIGDGFGPAHVTLARDVAGRPLALDSILAGAASTSSTDSRVTDSGAAATALATGVRTYSHAIGVDAGKRPRRSLLEAAEARGMATGLVATSRITHATPAAFAAHVASRDDEDAIAGQMLAQRIEVLFGGGARHFLPEGSGGRRRDGRDLLAEARRAGITVVTDRAGLAAAGAGPLLGLFASSHMSYALDRDAAREPSLPEMTRAALDRLKGDPDGFFLMVEGSRIDHAAHDHDAAATASEAIEFDRAVAVAVAFARADRRTLVVATADHETGGLSLGREVDGTSHYAWSAELLRGARRSAESMAQRIEAGASPREVVSRDAGVTDLTDAEAAAIASGRGEGRLVAIGDAVSRRARIGWTTLGHTAVDVPVWAFGPGAERLRGVRANDALGREIAACLGLRIGEPIATETAAR